jgi:hypothetical protein
VRRSTARRPVLLSLIAFAATALAIAAGVAPLA